MTTPFVVQKIGHAVINVADLEASKRFYTEVLGFKISDIYPGGMMPGGMVFLRCNADHHCLALIGGAPQAGEAKLTDVLTGAGFTRVRRAAEGPFNMVLEARP